MSYVIVALVFASIGAITFSLVARKNPKIQADVNNAIDQYDHVEAEIKKL